MITIDQKISCLGRECALRRQLYPGFVRRGRLGQAQAKEEIETMQAILDDYRGQRASLQPDLFGGEAGK